MIDGETIKIIINSGYLAMAILALAIAIITYPTIKYYSQGKSRQR